jgi:TP901 family phage tail tape measure protein
MSEALRSVLALFSINVDTEELEKADKKIKGFTEKLKKVGSVMAEAFAVDAITEFFEAQIEAAAHTEDLAEKLGLSTGSLNKFAFAAKSAGIDSDSAAQTLGFLNKNMGEALTGSKEAKEAFGKLGVKFRDTTGQVRPVEDVLLDVADGLEKLTSQPERAAYAMKLFGREGQALLPILSQGSEHVKELYVEASELGSGLGGKFYKDSKKAREEIEHFGIIINGFKKRITAAALPAITAMFEWFQKLAKPVLKMVATSNMLQHAMELLAAVAVYKLVTSLYSLAKILGILELETVLPFILGAAAVTLLYLAFDDLMTMLEGGDSLLGDFLDSLGGLGTHEAVVKALGDAWAWVKQSLVDAKTALGNFLDSSLSDRQRKDLADLNVVLLAFKTVAIAVGGALGVMALGAAAALAPFIILVSTIKVLIGLYKDLKDAQNEGRGTDTNRVPSIETGGATSFAGEKGQQTNDIGPPQLDADVHPAVASVDNGSARFHNYQQGVTVQDQKQYLGDMSTWGNGKGNVTNNFNVNVPADKTPELTGKKIATATASELDRYNANVAASRP